MIEKIQQLIKSNSNHKSYFTVFVKSLFVSEAAIVVSESEVECSQRASDRYIDICYSETPNTALQKAYEKVNKLVRLKVQAGYSPIGKGVNINQTVSSVGLYFNSLLRAKIVGFEHNDCLSYICKQEEGNNVVIKAPDNVSLQDVVSQIGSDVLLFDSSDFKCLLPITH